MSKRTLSIIGAGKRIREAVLPVLERLKDRYAVHKIYSRSGAPDSTRIGELKGHDLAGIDLIYLAVNKEQVPHVLKRLAAFDLKEIDLLIETPVLLFKHFAHVEKLKEFRNVWVAEDCAHLPCFDAIHEAVGEPRHIAFHHGAYKYHGLATCKTWLGTPGIRRAARRKVKPGVVRRDIRFSNGTRAEVFEPRDYASGSMQIEGSRGVVTDDARSGRLELVMEDGRCRGFRVGDIVTCLDEIESDLMGEGPGSTVTSRMDDMKRVGLYRMMKRIHEGGGGYPLIEALDDMVVDYYLDKLGFFHANPLMSIKNGSGAFLLRTVTRIVGSSA